MALGPADGSIVNVRLLPFERAEVERYARTQGMTLSEAVRSLLDHGLFRAAVIDSRARVSDGRSAGLRRARNGEAL